jgi:hypothetical protein
MEKAASCWFRSTPVGMAFGHVVSRNRPVVSDFSINLNIKQLCPTFLQQSYLELRAQFFRFCKYYTKNVLDVARIALGLCSGKYRQIRGVGYQHVGRESQMAKGLFKRGSKVILNTKFSRKFVGNITPSARRWFFCC